MFPQNTWRKSNRSGNCAASMLILRAFPSLVVRPEIRVHTARRKPASSHEMVTHPPLPCLVVESDLEVACHGRKPEPGVGAS